MKTLNVFTASFPYGNQESFLESEIIVLSKIKDLKITIYPSLTQSTKRSLPTNVHCDTSLANCLFASKFKKSPWNIITFLPFILKSIIQHKTAHLPSLRRIVRHAYNAKLVQKWSVGNSLSGSVCYTYWFDFQCTGLSLAAKRNYKVMTRCHRYDLYIEENSEGMIPFRLDDLKRIDYIFPISKHGLNYLLERYGSKLELKEKIIVSRLGIIKTNVQLNRINGDHIVIASCSFISKVKRIELMAKGIMEFARSVNKEVRWDHLGGGDSDICARVEILLADSPSNLKTLFHGNFTNKEVLEFYDSNQVDVFINTSESEGIPVSIMEAFSYGIPACATDVGGVSEIVDDSSGFLLSSNPSTREVAQGINHIVSNNLRVGALKQFQGGYNADVNYSHFYQHLEKLFIK